MADTVGFKDENGVDLQSRLVPKSYLIDNYPELANTFKTAGLWLWGYNSKGQLGDNTVTNKSSPVQTVAGGTNWKQVECGGYHNAAIKTDGTLWLWGLGNRGMLGDNSLLDKSSPIQTVAGGTNWKQVSGGYFHTAAIKTDGTLWLWGGNYLGQLGNNSSSNKSSPVQTVSSGTNWKLVSCGKYHTAAIKTDGTLWTWGQASFGNLGDNTVTNKSSPVQTVSAGTNWKEVSCGDDFNAAIKTDGTLWTWGQGTSGQLGDNTTAHKSSPVQTVSGGTDWKQVSSGSFHTAAIKTDGTLWLWGSNTNASLGDNTVVNKSSPVQTVAGGTNWKQVSSGNYSSVAIKTDGSLWAWGYNGVGPLGDNTVVNKSSPVQTVAGGTNWKEVSTSGSSTMAIRDDYEDLI